MIPSLYHSLSHAPRVNQPSVYQLAMDLSALEADYDGCHWTLTCRDSVWPTQLQSNKNTRTLYGPHFLGQDFHNNTIQSDS